MSNTAGWCYSSQEIPRRTRYALDQRLALIESHPKHQAEADALRAELAKRSQPAKFEGYDAEGLAIYSNVDLS